MERVPENYTPGSNSGNIKIGTAAMEYVLNKKLNYKLINGIIYIKIDGVFRPLIDRMKQYKQLVESR